MGDAFGKDVFKYGSDDWQARKIYEELATGSANPADQAMARRQLERMRS